MTRTGPTCLGFDNHPHGTDGLPGHDVREDPCLQQPVMEAGSTGPNRGSPCRAGSRPSQPDQDEPVWDLIIIATEQCPWRGMAISTKPNRAARTSRSRGACLEYRRCKTCKTWFAVTDDGRKADALYCRDACKSRDYRERKAQAQELAEQGKTPREIAEAVATDLATVKKWIGKRRS